MLKVLFRIDGSAVPCSSWQEGVLDDDTQRFCLTGQDVLYFLDDMKTVKLCRTDNEPLTVKVTNYDDVVYLRVPGVFVFGHLRTKRLAQLLRLAVFNRKKLNTR